MKKIIVIGGPTASSKSRLALKLALKLGGVIINADAIQVYCEIPVLSAQPSYAERELVPHALYSCISGEIVYSVGKWLDEAAREIKKAHSHNKVPIIVGGTGMYINSLINGLSKIPQIDTDLRENIRQLQERVGKKEFYELLYKRDRLAAEKLSPGDKSRVIRAYEVIEQTGKSILHWHQVSNYSYFDKDSYIYITSNLPRDVLYQKCNDRFISMIEDGALDEVEFINNNITDDNLSIRKSLGVKELTQYINGELSLVDAISKAQTSTRRFAKRQVTWFKNQIHTIDKLSYTSEDEFEEIQKKIEKKFI